MSSTLQPDFGMELAKELANMARPEDEILDRLKSIAHVIKPGKRELVYALHKFVEHRMFRGIDWVVLEMGLDLVKDDVEAIDVAMGLFHCSRYYAREFHDFCKHFGASFPPYDVIRHLFRLGARAEFENGFQIESLRFAKIFNMRLHVSFLRNPKSETDAESDAESDAARWEEFRHCKHRLYETTVESIGAQLGTLDASEVTSRLRHGWEFQRMIGAIMYEKGDLTKLGIVAIRSNRADVLRELLGLGLPKSRLFNRNRCSDWNALIEAIGERSYEIVELCCQEMSPVLLHKCLHYANRDEDARMFDMLERLCRSASC